MDAWWDGNPNDDVGVEELEPQEHILSASSAAGSCVTFNKGGGRLLACIRKFPCPLLLWRQ